MLLRSLMRRGKWICNFCQKVIGGGGINTVKKHLVGIKGEVEACPKVSPEVRFTMQGKLKETAQKEKEKRTTSVTILDDDEEMEETKMSTMKKGKRISTSNLHPFFTKGRFRDAEGTFGRSSVVASRNLTRPDEWWKLFGRDIPVLQKFAIRILSQTASSSGCERNWSVFERIHTKRRNRLEHQRLNDLVFVQYNLRLQNRLEIDMRSYDPVDYENIDKT